MTQLRTQPEAVAGSQWIDLEVNVPRAPAYAGEWVPLLLIVRRSDSWTSGVFIRNVASRDKDVQFDLDLLDRETLIRPGEVYRLTIPIRLTRPRTLALETIGLQIHDQGSNTSELVDLPARPLDIRPAIGTEIQVQVLPICAYEEGTRIQLTLDHRGTTPFNDLTVNLQPEDAIAAGKRTIQRTHFGPEDHEQLDLVMRGRELEVVMVASVDGQRPEARKVLAINSPPVPQERCFRFLEPRRLSLDDITVCERTGDEPKPVERRQAHYPLHGGEHYQITIRPQQKTVTRIKIRDIQGRVQVRDVEQDKTGAWKFWIDVTATAELFRKPETLFYEMECRGEHWTGEIALCLEPTRWRHWSVAAALGIALTVQGLAAAARFLHKADYDLTEAFADFHWRNDFNVLFLLSIPLAWGVFKAYDWLQFRLGN